MNEKEHDDARCMVRVREKEGHGCETVFVIKGVIRGATAAWKKVSLPSGSSVRHGAVSRMHVEPSIFRLSLPRDSALRSPRKLRERVRSPIYRVEPASRLRNTSMHLSSDRCTRGAVRQRSIASIKHLYLDKITCICKSIWEHFTEKYACRLLNKKKECTEELKNCESKIDPVLQYESYNTTRDLTTLTNGKWMVCTSW